MHTHNRDKTCGIVIIILLKIIGIFPQIWQFGKGSPSKYEILVGFNLAVAKVDCQTAKFKFPGKFSRYICGSRFINLYLYMRLSDWESCWPLATVRGNRTLKSFQWSRVWTLLATKFLSTSAHVASSMREQLIHAITIKVEIVYYTCTTTKVPNPRGRWAPKHEILSIEYGG